MNNFWVKYTFRFLHISTVVALGGKIIYDYIFPCGTNEISKSQAIFAAVAGTILILSGFINIFILKGKEKMKDNHKFWTGVLHTKFLTCILINYPSNSCIDSIKQTCIQIICLRCCILLCSGHVIYITIFEILQRILDRRKQILKVLMNLEQEILTYQIPYSYQDQCLRENINYLQCMRQNPKILENAIVHSLPFSGAFSNCARLKETFNKNIEKENNLKSQERLMLNPQRQMIKNEYMTILNIKKNQFTSATGFEPVRVNPADFESASLTTRTN
ncbi:hypothetical protein pb186bvf_020059 [Paramecium bursaria]